jgi:hypothetical protein
MWQKPFMLFFLFGSFAYALLQILVSFFLRPLLKKLKAHTHTHTHTCHHKEKEGKEKMGRFHIHTYEEHKGLRVDDLAKRRACTKPLTPSSGNALNLGHYPR